MNPSLLLSLSQHPPSLPHKSLPPAIILRVTCFPAFSALGLAELADELACTEVAQLHEYRLDVQTRAVEERSLCKICCDFPSINPKSLSILRHILSFNSPSSAFPLSPLLPSLFGTGVLRLPFHQPQLTVCCDFPSINPNFTGRPHRFAYSAPFRAQICCNIPSINPNSLSILRHILSFISPSSAFPLSFLLPSLSGTGVLRLPFHQPQLMVCCDFPSINPNFTGRPHRFAYSAPFRAQPSRVGRGISRVQQPSSDSLPPPPGTTIASFNAIMKHISHKAHTRCPTPLFYQHCPFPVFTPIPPLSLPPPPGTTVPSFNAILKHDFAQSTYQMPNALSHSRDLRAQANAYRPSVSYPHSQSPLSTPPQPPPGTTVPSFNAIMKYDFQQGTYQVYTLPPGRFCGEHVFAPRHHFQSSSMLQSGEVRSEAVKTGKSAVEIGEDVVGMGAEEVDDGWVLALVWDEEEMRSEVIVLDAMNLDKQPMARVILPKRVPYGFHGTFLPD
ncbi:unnamed protein product [Closterium sp. Naga37s-1]|nr:unnamed protein product [Closterium sp. Naga37s-1]